MNITEVHLTTKSREWLILNAVIAYLHHYPDHTHTQEYKDLKDELINKTPVQKRGRPAKRQRKKEATSNTTSKEESQTT